jgi:Protein of unknown function (DUF3037)
VSAPAGSPRPAVPPRRMAFEYAVLRAVPRVERGECVNVGVLLYCQQADFLDAAVHVDAARLRALDPGVDVEAVRAAVDAVAAACRGSAVAGAVAGTTLGQRFRWLTAPRSTVVQPGPVHGGVTTDPAREIAHLDACLVR